MFSSLRSCVALVSAALVLAPPASAFYTPLSEQAVREAYFLGQRRDQSMARFLDQYSKFLPPPAVGPHISAVTFLTPFAFLVQYSSRQSDYSAQQAAKDHHAEEEFVRIEIEIALTASYGPFLSKPTGSRSGSAVGYQERSSNFWKTFEFRVFDGEEEIATEDLTGEPQYACSHSNCTLSGATVRLQFPAAAFTSDSATIVIAPPEGHELSVDFDLATLR